ncbi:MAG: saccharopine dehydrogenase [Devosia sp.]|uniref:SDR family oxidoreductase n=1 Tax=Devosia sp. TaxID=1871048 RepID=UPI00260556B5|nr:SDR family oxidoreductase [Devosia sp.]MDB5585741.1 saccharopine dehydrogenase [Devosia sp.]
MRILVLGGYGGFGARLSRRLATDGWQVLVAGRSKTAAAALAAQLPGASALVVDRMGDLEIILRQERPFLLIDAAGPFQGDDGRVVRACIAERVHYIDLADARDFVGAIGAFDAAARAAGIVVISGGSSVPALSGAVVEELAAGMDAVHCVDMSISASNRATAGASVARAILSYVGRPIELWRGRRWVQAFGWQMVRRETYAVDGEAQIRRLVALADVPDHSILPEILPGKPSTTFRAGPEFGFQLLALWVLSWLVRWGGLSSLSGLDRWLLGLQGLTSALGSDRSAVKIVVKGVVGEALHTRSWTLIANGGDGPEIPTLPAQILARELREGRLLPGARHAGRLIALPAFREQFAKLAIREQAVSMRYQPLYQRVMGERFFDLPAPVRQMHSIIGDGGAAGTGTVTRGTSHMAHVTAIIMGFPPSGEHSVHVAFAENNGIETWTRSFSGHHFQSRLSLAKGLLIERFGPMRFSFDLLSTPAGLQMVMRQWSIFHVPMPLALAPRSEAREWAEGEDFLFDVPIRLPLVGMIVHYHGRLRRL